MTSKFYYFPCRAIISQIEDLEIHCKYGLVWSDSTLEYEVDPEGCQEIITLGKYKNRFINNDKSRKLKQQQIFQSSSDCGFALFKYATLKNY